MNANWKNPTEQDIFEFRSKPFFFVPTAQEEDICYDNLYKSLVELKEDGFGGIIFFNKSTAHNEKHFSKEEYLGERYMRLVKDCAKICTQLGLHMWIHDGYACPPGTDGGRINREKYPHLAPLRLRPDGDNSFKVEEVSWGFPALEYEESAKLHQQFTYEAYKKAVGEYFGNTIKGFFSDTDNRRVDDDAHEPNSPKKDYFPWTTNFKETFEKEYGYDITPFIPSILKRKLSREASDYWTHAGNLYQGWFKSNHEWCNKNGLLYTYHTSDASPLTYKQSPRSPIYTEGKTINTCAHGDYCGVDQMGARLNGGTLCRTEGYHIAKTWGAEHLDIKNPRFYSDCKLDLRPKQAQSTAFLKNKKGVFCEMFAANYWWALPQELMEVAVWQIINGVTFVCHHAYHYKFIDHLKYFAPPDFSRHSLYTHSNKYMNDMIAKYCYFTSRGTLKAPIAVIDISEDILDGLEDTSAYFDLCDKLSRMPHGYVVADEKAILENKDRFSLVIYAGFKPYGKRKEMLDKSGLPVISHQELDRIDEFVECKISYSGYGRPHFMRRVLDNGEELICVANLFDGTHMKGKLTILDKTFDLSLASGEIGFFTKDGQIIVDDRPESKEVILNVDKTAKVKFEKMNSIPLEWWKNSDGVTVAKTGEDKEIFFPFTVEEGATGVYKLFVPNSINPTRHEVYFDGTLLTSGVPDKFYDDKGLTYTIENNTPGAHVISIKKDCPFMSHENAYLMGEFDVIADVENLKHIMIRTDGCVRYIPQKATITLKKRSTTLEMNKSWCLQGQPFYSGGATYEFEVKLPDSDRKILDFGVVRNVCKLKVDGVYLGERVRQPYTFDLSSFNGKVKVEATVYNTNCNELDNFLSPSGLVDGAKICK